MMLDLYKNIKVLRKSLGLSQEELAKKVGYSDRSSIAKVESGKVDLPQSQIFNFAKALGVEPCELMGDSGIKEESPSPSSANLTKDEKILLDEYRQLNQLGKKEAIKRVGELTEIPKYTEKGGENSEALGA